MAYHSDMDEEDAIFPVPPSNRPSHVVTEENVAQLMVREAIENDK